jgi:hypothetical protein
MKYKLLILIVSFLALIGSGLASTNTITNGGFETVIGSEWVYSENDPSSALSGSRESTWANKNGSYDYLFSKNTVSSIGIYAYITQYNVSIGNNNNLSFRFRGEDSDAGSTNFFVNVKVNNVSIYSLQITNGLENNISLSLSSYNKTKANISIGLSTSDLGTDTGKIYYDDVSTNFECNNFCLYAKDNNGTYLNSFSAVVNGTTYNTTNGTLETNIPFNSSSLYNITVYGSGYFNSTISNINMSSFYQIATLYPLSSVQVYIRDETSNNLITANTSLTFLSEDGLNQFTNTTTSGSFYYSGLDNSTYTITIVPTGYTSRQYLLTVGNRTDQILNTYFTNSSSSTTISVTDKSSNALEGVSIIMYTFINGSYVPVESKFSDISGNGVFNYVAGRNYKFYLSKDGYDSKIFYLNPILSSTYTVSLDSQTLLDFDQDFDGITLTYNPRSYQNNNQTTFNFLIASTSGLLTDYGYNISYPGGSSVNSGNNALGSQLSSTFNITNATTGEVVNLFFYYNSTKSGYFNYTVKLPISNLNNTLSTIEGRTYGLTLFERILIVTTMLVSIVGIASMVGNTLAGLVLGLFIMSYMVYIGFIPIYLILPSMFIGVMFLLWRGS